MKLTKDERTRILEGSVKPIHRTDKPDIDKGAELVVSWSKPRPFVDTEMKHVFAPKPEPAMWITVTKILRRNKGGWAIYYDVTDNRHPNWYLSKAGYTRTKRNAIDDLEAAVDPKTQARLTAEARHNEAMRRQADREKAEEEARRQTKRVAAHLRDAAVRCARLGVDPTLMLVAVEREIREVERNIKDAA